MEAFKIKNGISAKRYLGSNGTETAGSVGYNLAGASYDSKSFSVSQDSRPYDMAFNATGTTMFVLGTDFDRIYQYSLSTGFDITTSSYDSVQFSLTSQSSSTEGFAVKPDGTKVYIIGGTTVYQYDLSTAWDLSTMSYASKSFSLTPVSEENPKGLAFKPDGTKMYMVGVDDDTVYQYTLSTAWDVSTASYDSVSFNVNSQAASPSDVEFNSDGTKLYVLESGNDGKVLQYSLSTAYNVSTASYDSVSIGVGGNEGDAQGIAFSSDGTKLYVLGFSTDTIYQYSTASYTQTLDLSTGTTFSFTPSGATTVSFTNPPATGTAIGFSVEIIGDGSAITWPTSVKWHLATAPTATATKELYTFVTTDGGTTYYGKKAAEGLA